nr:hypothetical protein [Serratia sp. ME43]
MRITSSMLSESGHHAQLFFRQRGLADQSGAEQQTGEREGA